MPDEALEGDVPPYVRLPEGSPEERYLHERREALGGPVDRETRKLLLNTEQPDDVLAMIPDLYGGAWRQAA